jgi:hypothetical protein
VSGGRSILTPGFSLGLSFIQNSTGKVSLCEEGLLSLKTTYWGDASFSTTSYFYYLYAPIFITLNPFTNNKYSPNIHFGWDVGTILFNYLYYKENGNERTGLQQNLSHLLIALDAGIGLNINLKSEVIFTEIRYTYDFLSAFNSQALDKSYFSSIYFIIGYYHKKPPVVRDFLDN